MIPVSNEINNLTLCFYYFRWLDEGEDDGKIVRELKIQEEYMDDILEKRNVRLTFNHQIIRIKSSLNLTPCRL
jgi:hypothetical protein